MRNSLPLQMSSESRPQSSPESGGWIDAHQHVFWHGRDDAGLVADMDEGGIAKAWLLTWEWSPLEQSPALHGILDPAGRRPDGTHEGLGFSNVLRAARRFPDRFIVGYCPHPLLGDAPALLKAAVTMHGVRVCGEWKFRIPLDDPRSLNLLRTAGELSLPVVIHLDVPYLANSDGKPVYQPDWYGGTVENLERALAQCPETVILGHAPGFWREISGDAVSNPSRYPSGPVVPGGRMLTLLEKFPNLWLDLSAGSGLGALKRDRGFTVEFLERFSDRVLFARDEYGHRLATFLAELPLSPETREKILWKNAEALLAK
jgi:predicted TIM-barrel fold metal-dependent hydrolase